MVVRLCILFITAVLCSCATNHHRVVHIDAPPSVVWSRIEDASRAQGRTLRRDEGVIVDSEAIRAHVAPDDLAWSPDGRWLATVKGRRLRVWDTHDLTRAPLQIRTSDTLTGVVWGPGYTRLWTLSAHGLLIHWQHSWAELSKIEERPLDAKVRVASTRILAQSSRRDTLAVLVNGALGTVQFPDVTHTPAPTLALRNPTCVAFDSDGDVLYAPRDASGWLGWELDTGALSAEVSGATTRCVLFSSARQQVLTSGDDGFALRVWAPTGERLAGEVPREEVGEARLSAVSPSGRHVLFRSARGMVLLNRESDTLTPLSDGYTDGRFNASDQLLLAGPSGRGIAAFDVTEDRRLWSIGDRSEGVGDMSVSVEAMEGGGSRVILEAPELLALRTVLPDAEGETFRSRGLEVSEGVMIWAWHTHVGFHASSTPEIVGGGVSVDSVGRIGGRFVLDAGGADAKSTTRHALNLWGGFGPELWTGFGEGDYGMFARLELGLEYEAVTTRALEDGTRIADEHRLLINLGPSLLAGSSLGVEANLELMMEPWIGLYARVGYLFEEDVVVGTVGISSGPALAWSVAQASVMAGLGGLMVWGIFELIASNASRSSHGPHDRFDK